LSGNKALATLPAALQQLAVMATMFPASMLMARYGRRVGFTVGALFGMAGAAVATYGVLQQSFWIFAAGAILTGVNGGFGQFYRFAAVDGAEPTWRSKAISYTLAGGVIAALLGPELAKLTRNALSVEFAGSFASLIVVSFVALAVLQFLRIPLPQTTVQGEPARPLEQIVRNRTFVVALLAALVGYAGMAFLMTVTPLAMSAHHHSFESAAFVIEWHILAMFAPSFVTGTLIARFGVMRILIAGSLLFASSIAVNLSGTGIAQFWFGLVLLGLAWNFLYVGGTTLLTETYRPSEKALVQAANDFVIFGTVTFAAAMSGVLHNALGWSTINLIAVPFVAATFAALVWLAASRRRQSVVVEAA
jgi:MFS family permease